MKSNVDPNYQPQKHFPSGNEGRLHPDLTPPDYWGDRSVYEPARARARETVRKLRFLLAGKAA